MPPLPLIACNIVMNRDMGNREGFLEFVRKTKDVPTLAIPQFPAAFEAAARLMGLSKAADELHVTPAAVSHQVKAVEEDLGIKLFDRENRRLSPTQEARAGLTELRRGFELFTEGVRRIRDSQANPMLRVTSEPTLAGSWLVPRLAKFRKDCPDLDVMIDASDRLINFEREAIDIGIRWGGGNYAGLASEQLFEDEEVFPVCHPKLLTGKHPL